MLRLHPVETRLPGRRRSNSPTENFATGTCSASSHGSHHNERQLSSTAAADGSALLLAGNSFVSWLAISASASMAAIHGSTCKPIAEGMGEIRMGDEGKTAVFYHLQDAVSEDWVGFAGKVGER